MYFADLEVCRYHAGAFDAQSWQSPLLAVGWLEDPHPFPRGTSPEFLARRCRALNDQALARFPAFSFRGLHVCSLCAACTEDASFLEESHGNLVIPGVSCVYLSPGRIDHYIEAHSYLPPKAFISAVERCPDIGSSAHREALCAANGGAPTPLYA